MFRMLHSSSGADDSDTTLLQPNRTNIPVHTETEQYTYIQSPAPEIECNNIRNMLSNKNFHKVISIWLNLFNHLSICLKCCIFKLIRQFESVQNVQERWKC
jgi:hypothetical protein